MVVVFQSRLLHALGVDDDDVMMKMKSETVRPSPRRCLAILSGLSMSDDEDVWPRQLRQRGGLRLVGARPGAVRLVGVGLDVLPSPRRCPARNGLIHRRKDMSVERLRLVGARPMLGKRVDVGVEVDLNDAA